MHFVSKTVSEIYSKRERRAKDVSAILMGNTCKPKCAKLHVIKGMKLFVALNNPKIWQSGVIMHVFHIHVCLCFIEYD